MKKPLLNKTIDNKSTFTFHEFMANIEDTMIGKQLCSFFFIACDSHDAANVGGMGRTRVGDAPEREMLIAFLNGMICVFERLSDEDKIHALRKIEETYAHCRG